MVFRHRAGMNISLFWLQQLCTTLKNSSKSRSQTWLTMILCYLMRNRYLVIMETFSVVSAASGCCTCVVDYCCCIYRFWTVRKCTTEKSGFTENWQMAAILPSCWCVPMNRSQMVHSLCVKVTHLSAKSACHSGNCVCLPNDVCTLWLSLFAVCVSVVGFSILSRCFISLLLYLHCLFLPFE